VQFGNIEEAFNAVKGKPAIPKKPEPPELAVHPILPITFTIFPTFVYLPNC